MKVYCLKYTVQNKDGDDYKHYMLFKTHELAEEQEKELWELYKEDPIDSQITSMIIETLQVGDE